MRKTIGIFAHVDAGKTTLSQQILLLTGALRDQAAPGGRELLLDDAPLERRRGITIFSSNAHFTHGGQEYTLIDTPGHVDFCAEAERCAPVLDCAVLVVSAVEGVQGHTEALWRLLERHGLPVLLFLNKADRRQNGADPERVLGELQRRFSPSCLPFWAAKLPDAVPQPLMEALAERDDALLEAYLEGAAGAEAFLDAARRLTAARRLFPVFCGSALTGDGVGALLDGLDLLLRTRYEALESAPFSACVYQIRHDQKGNRLAFLKVLSGRLPVRAAVGEEKVSELRVYTGPRFAPAPEILAGQVAAALGLSCPAGALLGPGGAAKAPVFAPVLAARVETGAADEPAARRAFALLADEDPALGVRWDPALRSLEVRVMGRVQLEVLQALALERFGLQVRFGPPAVRYLETIAAPAVGVGHFEPLRHYAEVWLRLSPGPRGSGITFESACSTDLLDASFQNLIRTHIFEKEHRGVLTGAPVTDLRVTLLTGRSHLKHTEGGDFREAVYRAVRQGLASAKSVLLEPFYDLMVTVPADAVGRVLSDIQRRHGSFSPPETAGASAVIRGRGPAVCFLDYAAELPAFTGGRGSFTAAFGGYEPCHNADEVIAAAGYDFERDAEDPAGSVFCSHGAGYPVRWDEVPAHAHCAP